MHGETVKFIVGFVTRCRGKLWFNASPGQDRKRNKHFIFYWPCIM